MLRALYQAGTQGIQVNIGQAVDQRLSLFNNHAFKAVAPKVTPPVVAPVVKPGKVNFYFTYKLREIGQFQPQRRHQPIGMSLFLQNYVLLAQTSDFMPFPSLIPDLEILEPLAHLISTPEVIIILTTSIVMVLLTFLIKFTRVGKAMRATAQDREMAMLVGVDVNRVISITFIVGSATAALGGVLIASHIGQINFYIGFIAGIKAFVAAVLGGIGSMPGAVLGSLVLGCAESFFTGFVSSDYEDVFAFIILVFILIFRPAGILGRSDTQKV